MANGQVRDLLDVRDLVNLIEDQLSLPEEWAGATINVGGGAARSLSLVETTEICRDLTGRTVPIGTVRETRRGDIPIYISDCASLHSRTDWRPEYSAYATLADTYAWLRDHDALVESVLT